MGGYILKRLGLAVAVALAVSMIAFLLLRLSGDPAIAIAGEGARAEDIEMVRKTYGFDRPLPVQYVAWPGRTLTGDFGESIYLKTPAAPLISPSSARRCCSAWQLVASGPATVNLCTAIANADLVANQLVK